VPDFSCGQPALSKTRIYVWRYPWPHKELFSSLRCRTHLCLEQRTTKRTAVVCYRFSGVSKNAYFCIERDCWQGPITKQLFTPVFRCLHNHRAMLFRIAAARIWPNKRVRLSGVLNLCGAAGWCCLNHWRRERRLCRSAKQMFLSA